MLQECYFSTKVEIFLDLGGLGISKLLPTTTPINKRRKKFFCEKMAIGINE
jgi:hypothetical protein